MRALAKEHGLTIGAIHAPSLLLTRKVWSTDPIAKIYRAVEVAQQAEIPTVVTHPPYKWQMGYRRWLDDRLPASRRAPGSRWPSRTCSPCAWASGASRSTRTRTWRIWKACPTSCWTRRTPRSPSTIPTELRRRFGARLRHVHLSDNAGRGWDSHLPPGQGVLALDAFLDDLAADGYEGTVSLEVDLRRYLTDADKLHDIMVSMREGVEAPARQRRAPAP